VKKPGFFDERIKRDRALGETGFLYENLD